MNVSLWILLVLTVVALCVAYRRDSALPVQGLIVTGRMLRGIWPELLLGFLLAGLFEVLVPARLLSSYLGQERALQGVGLGWAIGLAMPGGPYVVFPIVASLLEKGAAAGPIIALVSAKTLVSPLRVLTYEAPLLGWPLALARLIPALFVPPLLGILGQWLYSALARS